MRDLCCTCALCGATFPYDPYLYMHAVRDIAGASLDMSAPSATGAVRRRFLIGGASTLAVATAPRTNRPASPG